MPSKQKVIVQITVQHNDICSIRGDDVRVCGGDVYLWVQVHPCMPGTMTVNGKSSHLLYK